MATVAWVHAVRGKENKVCELHEEMLRGMLDFFEHCRLKGPKKDVLNAKELSLPGKGLVKDWFVPRGAEPFHGRFGWVVSTAEERVAHGHLANLYRLGVPSFLREPHKKDLMKLFVPLEAYVKEASLPPASAGEAARQSFWKSLKTGLIYFVAETMVEAAVQMFGSATKQELLVAVFDACGYSPAADRWKISFRICFIEVAVCIDTALEARDLFVRRLDDAWLRLQQQLQQEESLSRTSNPSLSWVAAVEPIQRPASSADSQHSFWSSILDRQPFKSGAQHRLVFCDVMHGDDEALLPEGRPLLPYGLFNGVLSSGSNRASLKCLKETETLDAYDWAKLGSVWTTQSKTTTPWQARCPRSKPANPERRKGGGGNPTAVHPWVEWKTPEGIPYYHNPETGDVKWELPAETHLTAPSQDAVRQTCQDPPRVAQVPPEHQWEAYQDGSGRAYYHNKVLECTEWELPPGAQLLPGQLRPVQP